MAMEYEAEEEGNGIIGPVGISHIHEPWARSEPRSLQSFYKQSLFATTGGDH